MHYRNGREAKNGDKVIQLNGGKVTSVGVLFDAQPGNDFCNGALAPINGPIGACLCDCIALEDIEAMLAEKGLDKRK